MVVNPYLFGMTNPHELNRSCNNSRAKDDLGHLVPPFPSP